MAVDRLTQVILSFTVYFYVRGYSSNPKSKYKAPFRVGPPSDIADKDVGRISDNEKRLVFWIGGKLVLFAHKIFLEIGNREKSRLRPRISGLDVCEDKSNDCHPCNLPYPVQPPYRDNCMKTCQVCTNDKNIAFNQTTKQSSFSHKYGESYKAVDANTNGIYGEESCAHTEDTGTQWWCVDLKKIYNIKNITIYNRVNFGERLQGFEVKTASSGQCNAAGFSTSSPCYRNDPPTNQRIYTIEKCNQDSNKSVSARTLFVSVRSQALTICEFQVYTGTTCSYGYYNTSSSSCKPCDSCSGNKCHPDTGDCIGACKAGVYGTKCQQNCSEGCQNKQCTKLDGSCSCINGWFGSRCQLTCDTGCKDGVCDQSDGRCSRGCIPGRYGDQCSKTCSPGCSTTDCNRDGPCSCRDGFKGSFCQTPCDVNCRRCDDVSCSLCKPGWFGKKCETRCPTGCKEGCNKTSGTCDECREGTVGLYCDIRCGGDCRIMNEKEKRWSTCREGNCNKTCKGECYGLSCDVMVDRCAYFCIGGQTNGQCLNFKVSAKDPISAPGVGIGVAIGLIVGAFVCGLISWFCFLRRLQAGDQKDNQSREIGANDSRVEEISITNNSASQPSVLYQNQGFLSHQQTNPYDSLDPTTRCIN